MIVYESPHRLKETLKLMLIFQVIGKYPYAGVNQKHEDYMRSSIDEAISYYKENDPRGEYILIIEGNTNPCKEEGLNEYEDLSDRDYVIKLIENNITKKDAIKTVAKERGLRKDDVYKQVLDL